MTGYAADADGAVVCLDCLHGACVAAGPCEAEECMCECGRARDLDDRPEAALHNIARDLEAESKPAVAEVVAERFGLRRRR